MLIVVNTYNKTGGRFYWSTASRISNRMDWSMFTEQIKNQFHYPRLSRLGILYV